MKDIKKMILILDDDLDMCRSLKDIFEDLDYEVMQTDDGNEAIDWFKNNNFSLVVSDLIMDKMNGLEFLTKIAQLGKNVPMFIITAYPSEEKASQILQLGVKKIFVKPFDIEDMIKTFNEVMLA